MNVRQINLSRRPITVAAALVGLVSLALGAHASLYKRPPNTGQAIAADPSRDPAKQVPRLALVIGNANYPDANTPLTQPINDARALTRALRRDGFDVDVVED